MNYRNSIIVLGFLIVFMSTGIINIYDSWTSSIVIALSTAIIVIAYLSGRRS